MKKNSVGKILFVATFLMLIFSSFIFAQQPETPTIPKVNLVFTHSHYVDHTYAIIGIKQGYFQDVGIGIQPAPNGRVVAINEMSAVLAAGTVDIATVYAPIVVGWMNRTTDLLQISFCDLFQGGSIMAKPQYKSVQEFIDEGKSFQSAVENTMAQLKGKGVIFSSDLGQKGLRELAFELGKLDNKDIRTTILEDTKLVEFALAGRADFAFPAGAPMTVQLLINGWKPIVSTKDFVDQIKPDPNDKTLLSLGFSGWGVRRQWLEKNHDTALRLLSVMFRTIDFIQQFPDKAVELQLPFFNSVTGTTFKPEQIKYIYSQIDPFFNFEEQRRFWVDKSDPLYYEWCLTAHIRNYEKDGVMPKGKFKPDDVIVGRMLYEELVKLKEETELTIPEVRRLLIEGELAKKDLSKAQVLLKNAVNFYEIRDYLDANRFSLAAKKWALFALR